MTEAIVDNIMRNMAMWRGVLVSVLAGACLSPTGGLAEDDDLVAQRTISPEPGSPEPGIDAVLERLEF